MPKLNLAERNRLLVVLACGISQTVVAGQYNVSRSTISRLVELVNVTETADDVKIIGYVNCIYMIGLWQRNPRDWKSCKTNSKWHSDKSFVWTQDSLPSSSSMSGSYPTLIDNTCFVTFSCPFTWSFEMLNSTLFTQLRQNIVVKMLKKMYHLTQTNGYL